MVFFFILIENLINAGIMYWYINSALYYTLKGEKGLSRVKSIY